MHQAARCGRMTDMKWTLLCLLAAASAAQTTFRSDVRLVNLTVTVKDGAGRLVEDLSPDDFEVAEDGFPRKIALFARSSDVPLNLGLVVDISGSQAAFRRAHLRDLRAFLDQALGEHDRAFLECFAADPRLVVDYTSSSRQLVDGLEGYIAAPGKRAYPLLGKPVQRVRNGGTAFYDAIYHAANRMFQKVERGRKALIVFSDAEDSDSVHPMEETIEMAQSNDVLIFAIGYYETVRGVWNSRHQYGRSVMERVARETGGADFDASQQDVSSHFREIGEQLRSSYEIAYHSSNPPEDRTFHKVAVRVKRPGLVARAKTGYYAK